MERTLGNKNGNYLYERNASTYVVANLSCISNSKLDIKTYNDFRMNKKNKERVINVH